jgi:hypothetical protein
VNEKRVRASPGAGSVALLLATAVALAAVLATASRESGGDRTPAASDVAATAGSTAKPRPLRVAERAPARPSRTPTASAVEEARRYARGRDGLVSFAVVDTRGRLLGEAQERQYAAASVVKSMLLAAELQRLERERAPLDGETESLLRAMITYSDNDAADAIYSRVGDAGLFAVAGEAGMRGFTVAGHWGNAQITAADMARYFSDLDAAFAGPHREFGLGLLGSIVSEQRWGIPAAAGDRWAVRFKGGWIVHDSGQLAHQAAELRDGDRRLAIALLTDAQPSMSYATQTLRGVAERLLSSSPSRGDRASSARPGS